MQLPDRPSHEQGHKPLLILLAAVTATTPLAMDMYLPAMPSIATDFNSHISLIQMSISLYIIGIACGLMLFGSVADQIGRRPSIILGLSGFSLCGFLSAYCDSAVTFLILRFLQAFFGSAATVAVPGIISDLYKEHAAKQLSYQAIIMMLAPLLAPSIGGLLIHFFSWHWIFWGLSSYGLLILLSVYLFLPETGSKKKPQLQQAFQNYVVVLTNKAARRDIVASMCGGFAFFAYLTAIPFIYIEFFGIKAEYFGLLFGLNIFALMLGNFVNGRLVGRYGTTFMIRAALINGFLVGLLLISVLVLELHASAFIALLFQLMISLAIIRVNLDARILIRFDKQASTASGVVGTLRFASGAMAGPALALVFNGTALPFALLIFVALIGIIVCQSLPNSSYLKTAH